jgi:hypothetical protein
MEPFQPSMRRRFGLLLSVLTFGLLAPVLVSFREERLHEHKQKTNYEMTVNQTKEEEEEMKKELLPRKTKK